MDRLIDRERKREREREREKEGEIEVLTLHASQWNDNLWCLRPSIYGPKFKHNIYKAIQSLIL